MLGQWSQNHWLLLSSDSYWKTRFSLFRTAYPGILPHPRWRCTLRKRITREDFPLWRDTWSSGKDSPWFVTGPGTSSSASKRNCIFPFFAGRFPPSGWRYLQARRKGVPSRQPLSLGSHCSFCRTLKYQKAGSIDGRIVAQNGLVHPERSLLWQKPWLTQRHREDTHFRPCNSRQRFHWAESWYQVWGCHPRIASFAYTHYFPD